jgi:hypothetical protein
MEREVQAALDAYAFGDVAAVEEVGACPAHETF